MDAAKAERGGAAGAAAKAEEKAGATEATLRMGAGQSCMNLKAVRDRTRELQGSLQKAMATIGAEAQQPGRLQWSDVLDLFAILNVQYRSLVAELRDLLKHYVVHPKNVTPEAAGHLSRVLPHMFATRPLPEQEALEARLMQEHAEASAGLSVNKQYAGLQQQTERYNTLCEVAAKVLEDGRKTLKTARDKGPGAAPAASAPLDARVVDRLVLATVTGEGLAPPPPKPGAKGAKEEPGKAGVKRKR